MVDNKGKLKGIDQEFVDLIYQEHLFDYIVVEADGSRRRPIKAPAHYEPVIPRETTHVIGVIGLDALGKTITEDTVHRPHLFCSITGKKMGDTIDRKCFIHLILSQDGLFKDVPPDCKKYVIFNKADHVDREKEARITVNELLKMQASINGCIISAMDKDYVYAPQSMKVNLKEISPGEIEVKYKSDVSIVGKLAMFGDRIMRSKARQVEEEFTKNLQEKLQDAG